MLSEEIAKKARDITTSLLPTKSREQYEKEYNIFKEWMRRNNLTDVNEEVVLVYLHEKVRMSECFTLAEIV